MVKNSLIVFLLLISSAVGAQVGGIGVYKFLNIPVSARVASIGGNSIASFDNDINLAFQNPALLHPSMNRQITFNYTNLVSDINAGYAGYCFHLDSIGTFAAGLQYLNYGTFDRSDVTGNKAGTFSAADYNLQIAYGNNFKKFRYGTNLKLILSNLAEYQSIGISTDLCGSYVDTASRFTGSLVFKNIGFPIKNYVSGQHENLPFEIQVGMAKQLAHLPLRFSIVYTNLQRFNIAYTNPNSPNQQIDLETGEPILKTPSFGDKLMRHFIFGGEFLFSKNFNLRVGYNYQRRREMQLFEKNGLAGFSWGVGIKISKFQFSYGGGRFAPGQTNQYFSVVSNLHSFRKS